VRALVADVAIRATPSAASSPGLPPAVTLMWASTLASLLAALALYVIGRARHPGIRVTLDGRRYLAMGGGRSVAMPFALRWLLPAVCGSSVARWRRCTAIHLVLLPVMVSIWLSPWIQDPLLLAVGGLLVCGLPGVWRIHLGWPVLVDATAMTWAVGSAIALQHRRYVLGAALALVAGCIKESGPVFAACYAWHPVALVGLAAPALRRMVASIGPDIFDEQEGSILAHPLRAGLAAHAGRWLDPRVMLTPWGVGLLGCLVTPRPILPMLIITLILAYGQLLVATDSVRLYQWAAPPVILATISVIPPKFAVMVLLVHLFNPWSGDGGA
jgi:hypothetical protein